MTDFPSNSQRPRRELRPEPAIEAAQKAKVEKVVEGEVVFRKKPLGRRFRETFLGGDGTTVWEYVRGDILVPALQDLIHDITIGSVERMLYPDGGIRPHRRPGRGVPVRYDLASRGGLSSRRDDPRPQMSRRARASHDFDEIILDNRVEAERVLRGLFDILDQYEQVTVQDLYELVGVSGNWTDERYGWTDLRGSRAVRTRQGYLLELPRTEVLER